MPLVGGGGAPNVAGSNPAGTGSSLNYIGNHAYANSGSFLDTQSQQTMLKFTIGNEYIRGKFTFFGSTDVDQAAADISAGNINNFQVLYDDQVVAVVKTETGQEDMPTMLEYTTIIPSHTKVEIKVVAATAAADFNTFVTFEGRVYA